MVMKRDFRESSKYALLLLFLKISYQWKCTVLCIPFSSSCHGTFLMACFLWHRTSPGTRWTNLSVVTTGLPIHFPVLMVSAFTPAPDLYIISLFLLICFHRQNMLTSVFPKTFSVPSLSPPIYSSFLLFLPLCFSPFSLSFPLLIPSSSVCFSFSVSHTHGHNTHTHTFSEHPECVRGFSTCSGDTMMNKAGMFLHHRACVQCYWCCSFSQALWSAKLTLIYTTGVVKGMDFGVGETRVQILALSLLICVTWVKLLQLFLSLSLPSCRIGRLIALITQGYYKDGIKYVKNVAPC